METMGRDEINKLITELESSGESAVRKQLPSGRYGSIGSDIRSRVDDWLRGKEAEREEETLKIAKKALSVARRANIIAGTAILFSVAAAIIAAIIGTAKR